MKYGNHLRKLKISRTNVNDDKIVNLICQIIESNVNMHYIDVSWSSLSSKHMFIISQSLNKSPNPIMNLNIGNNSLNFVEPRHL